jgi:hypothetical protein
MAHGKHRRRRGSRILSGDARKVAILKELGSQERSEYGSDADTVNLRFRELACTHPEACSCEDDYPGWRPGDR